MKDSTVYRELKHTSLTDDDISGDELDWNAFHQRYNSGRNEETYMKLE